MREIIFRGKCVDNGEWVQGYVYQIWESVYILWGMTNGVPNMIEVLPETIGQYTGLTDKNGTKIFEGDILKDDWGKVCEVFYSLDSCSFMVYCSNPPNEYEKGNYRIGKVCCETIRVIGNIHDNPELLGGE